MPRTTAPSRRLQPSSTPLSPPAAPWPSSQLLAAASHGDSAIARETSVAVSNSPPDHPLVPAPLADLSDDERRDIYDHLSATGNVAATLSLLSSPTLLSPAASDVAAPSASLFREEEEKQIRSGSELARRFVEEPPAAPPRPLVSETTVADANRDVLCARESYDAAAAAARERDRSASRDHAKATENVRRLERLAAEATAAASAAAASAAAARLASSRQRAELAARQAQEVRNANVVRVAVAKNAVRRTEEALRHVQHRASSSPSPSPPPSPGPSYSRVVADGRPFASLPREGANSASSSGTIFSHTTLAADRKGGAEHNRPLRRPAHFGPAGADPDDSFVRRELRSPSGPAATSLASRQGVRIRHQDEDLASRGGKSAAPVAETSSRLAAAPSREPPSRRPSAGVAGNAPPSPGGTMNTRGFVDRPHGGFEERPTAAQDDFGSRPGGLQMAWGHQLDQPRGDLRQERDRLALDFELASVRFRHSERAVTDAWRRSKDDEAARRDFIAAEDHFLRCRRALWEVEARSARFDRLPLASYPSHDWELQKAAESAAAHRHRSTPDRQLPLSTS